MVVRGVEPLFCYPYHLYYITSIYPLSSTNLFIISRLFDRHYFIFITITYFIFITITYFIFITITYFIFITITYYIFVLWMVTTSTNFIPFIFLFVMCPRAFSDGILWHFVGLMLYHFPLVVM